MTRVKVINGKSLIKIKTPLKIHGVKLQANKTINKVLASVHASMAVEGLRPSKTTIAIGRQYLEGKISGLEAIERIKARHLVNLGIHND